MDYKILYQWDDIDFVLYDNKLTCFYIKDNVGDLSMKERADIPYIDEVEPIGYLRDRYENNIVPYYYCHYDKYIIKYDDIYYTASGQDFDRCYINENIETLKKL